jgi:Helix-turn-helix domain
VASAALGGGFVLLPRTLLHAAGLSRDAKLLYAVLLSYAWQRGSCFPGAERLQADLGCGKNQVTRYLQELEHAGLLSRRRRGQGKTTVYTLHDPPGPPTAPTATGQAARPPSPDSPQEGAQTPQIGESRRPETGSRIRLSGTRSRRTSTVRGPSTSPHRPTHHAGAHRHPSPDVTRRR